MNKVHETWQEHVEVTPVFCSFSSSTDGEGEGCVTSAGHQSTPPLDPGAGPGPGRTQAGGGLLLAGLGLFPGSLSRGGADLI